VSSDWKDKVGKGTSVNWPAGLGARATKAWNRVDQADAEFDRLRRADLRRENNIAYGAVKNASGAFVKADLAGVSEAAAGAAKDMPDDFRVSIPTHQAKRRIRSRASPGC